MVHMFVVLVLTSFIFSRAFPGMGEILQNSSILKSAGSTQPCRDSLIQTVDTECGIICIVMDWMYTFIMLLRMMFRKIIGKISCSTFHKKVFLAFLYHKSKNNS